MKIVNSVYPLKLSLQKIALDVRQGFKNPSSSMLSLQIAFLASLNFSELEGNQIYRPCNLNLGGLFRNSF